MFVLRTACGHNFGLSHIVYGIPFTTLFFLLSLVPGSYVTF